jgi:hypothetical protein
MLKHHCFVRKWRYWICAEMLAFTKFVKPHVTTAYDLTHTFSRACAKYLVRHFLHVFGPRILILRYLVSPVFVFVVFLICSLSFFSFTTPTRFCITSSLNVFKHFCWTCVLIYVCYKGKYSPPQHTLTLVKFMSVKIYNINTLSSKSCLASFLREQNKTHIHPKHRKSIRESRSCDG